MEFSQKEGHQPKVGNKPSVIEINGNRYNAVTGQLIGTIMKTAVIDGFRRRTQTSPLIKKAKRGSRRPAQTIHHRAQRSKTLMRTVVARPTAHKEHKLSSLKARSDGGSARLSKAMSVAKSATVSRFGNPSASANPKAVHHRASHAKKAVYGEIMNAKPQAGSTAVAIRPLPSMMTSVSHQRLERMLDEALIKADAHKQALKGRIYTERGFWQRVRRLPLWLVIGLSVLIVALAAGFFAWRSVPQFSMKVSSMQAKIQGSVPGYIPSGYSFSGPVKNEDGALSMTFRSGEDGRSFKIVEQASNWDSSSLAANAVAPSSQVQTSQVKGTTVYIYDSNNQATWVNNGIRYIIEGDAQLNSDQLLKIADSL